MSQQDLWVDTAMIPRDTVQQAAVQSTRNGLILLNNNKFSGYVATTYPDKRYRTITSVYEGMIHGIFRSYYENGALHEVRQYKQNLSTGKHYGFWTNGNKQFDYVYFHDRKIGYMKRWYENGKPYLFLNYKEDKEEGLQQGWRENGKLFINYIAKEGYRYGLQETMLCYKLNEGNIIK
jgi:antitoxin component YwqK of YwqJK toxin-antitoxin module